MKRDYRSVRRTASAFLDDIRAELREHNVKLELTKGKNVYVGDGSGICYGYFAPPANKKEIGRIRVAAGDQSLCFLICTVGHEYIHFRQFFNKETIFQEEDYYKLEKNTEKRMISLLKRRGFPKWFIAKAKALSEAYLKEIS